MSFEKDNLNSLKFIKEVEKIWKGLGEFYLIPFINMHTLFVETGKQKNSSLIILIKGGSKSDFLTTIYSNNPKSCVLLPEKMYESMLSKKPKEFFNNKIMIHTDLIAGFTGLNNKQREQLISFWTSILSDMRYERQDVQEIKLDSCVVMFGLAFNNYHKYKERLFESTFLDRVTTINKPISLLEKVEILRFMLKNDLKNAQKVRKNAIFRLKMRKKPLKIAIFMPKFEQKIVDFSIDFDILGVMSFTRAKNYIVNFLMANAYFNDRLEVTENDMKMFEKLYSFHVDKKNFSMYNKLALAKKENPNLNNEELRKKLDWNKGTYYKYNKIYNEKMSLK